MNPYGNRILVEQEKVAETTAGGIVIANADNAPVRKGVVKAVGFGKFSLTGGIIAVPIKEGSTVWYYRQSAQIINENGVENIFVDADQILAWE